MTTTDPATTAVVRRLRSQDGSAAVVELALGAAVIVVAVWLVIWAGSGGQTSGQARTAAQDAARIASTTREAAARPGAATSLVDSRLAGSDCASWTTATTSSATLVTVTVTCRLATAQMAGLGVPARTITATGRSTIDPYFQTS